MVRPSKLDDFREIITEKYTAGCSNVIKLRVFM